MDFFKNNKFNALSHCPRSLYMNYMHFICKNIQKSKRQMRKHFSYSLPLTNIVATLYPLYEMVYVNIKYTNKTITSNNQNIYINKKQKHTPTTIQNVFNVLFYLMASAFHFIVNIYINFKRKFIWIFSIYLH